MGDLRVVTRGGVLCALEFVACERRLLAHLERRFGSVLPRPAPRPSQAAERLGAYLGGALDAFDGLAIDAGGTPFQRRVWAALRRIPCGTTTTYGELARSLGDAGDARAVGLANSQNPVAIAVPCHRVIGAGGRLTGYAGGLDRKRWLLEHEGALLPLGATGGPAPRR